MGDRRLVGVDLGIASAHTVRVLDGQGNVVAKRRAWPTVESLSDIERAALVGAVEGTRLEVVMEPTGPAWLPIAVFFTSRGHVVHRVSSAKSHDLRKFLSRHTKTNGIDADTLARIPLFDPAGVQPLVLASEDRAGLDRRVRATDRLTQAGADHKRRIKDLTRQVMPMTPLAGVISRSDLAVLQRYANPNSLVKLGVKRLTKIIAKASANKHGEDRAVEWIAAATSALELYRDHPAVAFDAIAEEIATEVRLLRAVEAERARHAAAREDRYMVVDPEQLARSIPGFSTIGGPALVACMGDPARFARGKQFRSFTGLTPKASETGNTDRKGQAMSKAGSSLLRTTLIRAADHGRRHDPQLARIYYIQMVERGKNHLGALCVVAANLAERAWTVMTRNTPYIVCDIDGTPVTNEQATAIIADHWTVPAEVRARRRSTKTAPKGKAPQAVSARQPKPHANGAETRGDLPRPTSSTPHFPRIKTLAESPA